MKKLSLALILSLPLFIGCGSSNKDNTLQTYADNTYSNYKNRPDVPNESQNYILPQIVKTTNLKFLFHL